MSWPMAEPTPLRPQTGIQKCGLGWRWETTEGLILSVDYVKRRGDELHGWLTIESAAPAGRIHKASFNFSSFTTRGSLAKHLAGRAPSHDWPSILEAFCEGIMDRSSDGDDFARLEPPGATGAGDVPEWAIEELVPKNALTWWYGARGSCKSQTAALMAVCLSHGVPFLDEFCPPDKLRVGILDYEDSKGKWEGYIKQICAGLDLDWPEIVYRTCKVPLVRQVHNVARLVDGEGLDVLINDSFAMAGGAASEHVGWEEIALGFCAAAKEIGRTWLVIDHISQQSRMNPHLPADPGGSGQKLAQARAGYELRMEKEHGSPEAHIGIFDRKHGMHKPIGVKAVWDREAGTLTFNRELLESTNTKLAADALPLAERVLWVLKGGAMKLGELAHRLGATEPAVGKALGSGQMRERVTKLPDGRWGLSAQEIYGSEAL